MGVKKELLKNITEDRVEMISIIKQAKNGDEESIYKIINKLKGAIAHYHRIFSLRGYDLEDSIQMSSIVIIKALQNYDFNTNGYYYRYFSNCIKNKFFDMCRKLNKEIESKNTQWVIREGDYTKELVNTIELIVDSKTDVEAEVIEIDLVERLIKAIGQLSEEERELIKVVFYEEKTINQYSKIAGVSWHIANKRQENILRNIKKNINEFEL